MVPQVLNYLEHFLPLMFPGRLVNESQILPSRTEDSNSKKKLPDSLRNLGSPCEVDGAIVFSGWESRVSRQRNDSSASPTSIYESAEDAAR